MRRNFSAKVKLAAWERSGGRCEKCLIKIVARPEYDHRIPDAMGGEPTIENCECLCTKCHKLKTLGEDIPRIKKTRHQRSSHIGAHRSRNPVPGSRGSKFRKKMSGEVEMRDADHDT